MLNVAVGEESPSGVRGWPRRLGSLPRPVVIHLLVLIGYLAAGVIVNWTRVTYLFDHVVTKERDSGLYTWDFWWMAHSVTHLSNPFFTAYQAAPVGAPLAFHTLMPLPGALMTPITLAFGPGFTYNLLTALAPGLTCYAMYRAARLWLPTQAGAIAAGALFGLSTIITWNDWYEAQLSLGQIFLPLALEAAVRLRRRPGWRQATIFGVVLGTALLTDQESAILAGVLGGLALLPWLFRRPSRGGDPVMVKLRSVALAGVVFLVITSPQLYYTYQQGHAGYASVSQSALSEDYIASGATLQQMFAPSPRVAWFGAKGLAHYYYDTGPISLTMVCYGVVLTALALFGLVVYWRRRSSRLLALLWIGATVLAMGTAIGINDHLRFVPFAQAWHGVRVSLLMPYTWMVRISLLSSFREANRITELGLVPAALLAAAGVDWLGRHARPALLVVCALAVLEMGGMGAQSGPIQLVTMPTSMPALDKPIAADHSKSIVVDVPFGVRSAVPWHNEGAGFDDRAQVVATEDGHPRVIAYISRLPYKELAAVFRHPFYGYLLAAQNDPDSLYKTLFTGSKADAARLAAAQADARRMDVGWAIVWRSTPVILRYLQAVGLRFDYQADGVPVYRMAPASQAATP